MRKTIFTLGLMLAAALSLTSCSKNEEVNFTPELKPSFELFANLDSRTVNVVDDDRIGTDWAAGDAINVFHAVATSDDYKSDGSFSTEDASGLFKGNLSEELTAEAYDWYALYPYKSYITTPAEQTEGYVYIGSKSNEVQTQNGNNSMAHIAGKNYPLVGVVKNVPASVKPEITMSHISSLVEFNVTNTLDEDITVTAIRLTSVEDIIGSYYINFAGDDVVYKNHTEYWSATATLEVKNGTPIKKGESAKFYMAIKPHSVDDDFLKVEVDATAATGNGTFSKSYSDVTTSFVAGKIKTIKVDFKAEFEAETGLPLPFEEKFDEGQGDFTIDNVEIGSLSYVWKHDSNYKYMKASAYANDIRYETESWLISPLIAIPAETAANPILTFENAINYTSTPKNSLALKVYADGEWNDVTIPNYGTGNNWTFVKSGDINLSAYKGKNIKFAFVYTSTATVAATVEIKNVVLEVRKLSQVLSFPEAAYTVKTGDTFTAPELSGAKTTVTYTSSNTDVATVNATSGAITLGNTVGSTVITATAAEDDYYNSATATYTIVLEDSSITTTDVTISFASIAQRTSQSTSKQVWANEGVTFTNNKGTGSNVGNYSNPVRLYKSSNIVITAPGNITSIKFVANSPSYATALKNSIGSSASASGSNVVVTLDGSSDTFTVATLTEQVRLNSVTVTYIAGGDVVTPEPEPEPEPEEPELTGVIYTLLKDVSSLNIGDKVVIAAKDSNYAMSTEQKSNNRGQAEITRIGDKIGVGDNAQVLTVEDGTKAGTFAFNTGSGYLYAASSSSNHLKTKKELDDNGSWTITIAADGTADVNANGDNARKVLQYNQQSSLFACYSSANQNAIAIYRLVE